MIILQFLSEHGAALEFGKLGFDMKIYRVKIAENKYKRIQNLL